MTLGSSIITVLSLNTPKAKTLCLAFQTDSFLFSTEIILLDWFYLTCLIQTKNERQVTLVILICPNHI